METAGIVAEYNPFHTGHAYLAQKAREQGAKTVVAVMSGGVVQRGAFPLFPAAIRAEAALAGGVDLVIELPAPYALQSAEGFAKAAVGLLGAFGQTDALFFGCECGDASLLYEAARLLQTPEFSPLLKEELAKGDSFPAARQRALEKLCPGAAAAVQGAGNLLGVEYCKALQQLGLAIQPFGVLRRGAGHDAEEEEGGFASASALRSAAEKGDFAFFMRHSPPGAGAVYRRAFRQGAFFLPGAGFDIALLGALRRLCAEELAAAPGAGEGLENALLSAARRATCAEELYALAKSKRYTHSRVRRLALAAALGYTEPLPAAPPYLHILGATPKGLALLQKAKPALPLSHSLRRLSRENAPCLLVAQKSAAAADLYTLLLQKPAAAGAAFTAPFLRPGETLSAEG